MERSDSTSTTMPKMGNMHSTVTLISGLGLGLGVAVAAIAFFRRQQEAKAASVDSIVRKCRSAAGRLEERLEKGIRQAS